MSRRISSAPFLTRYQPFIQTTTTAAARINTTHAIVIVEKQSKIQRWIFGMFIGSAPFLLILFCWMFVSLCINNVVRFYQHRRKRRSQIDGIGNIASKINI